MGWGDELVAGTCARETDKNDCLRAIKKPFFTTWIGKKLFRCSDEDLDPCRIRHEYRYHVVTAVYYLHIFLYIQRVKAQQLLAVMLMSLLILRFLSA